MNFSNMRHRTILVAVVAISLVVSFGAAPSALAEPPSHAGKGKAKHDKAHEDAKHSGRKGQNGRHGGGTGSTAKIETEDRVRIQAYFGDGYGQRDCPPGLAKKNNGCVPPGQAKKYARGDVVPGNIQLVVLPAELEVRLRPLPSGYVYRRVDGDVLVVAEAARKVIDIVVLLSTL